MPRYEIDIPHALGPGEVRTRIDGAIPKIASKYGATCRWTGDRHLAVSRKGFDAQVAIDEARVHIDMSLGFLLVPLAPAIKAGLTRELATLLSDPA